MRLSMPPKLTLFLVSRYESRGTYLTFRQMLEVIRRRLTENIAASHLDRAARLFVALHEGL